MSNNHDFKIKNGLQVEDGITVNGGAVDFTNASSISGITASSLGSIAQSDVTGLVAALDAKVDVAGDTMTGALTLSGDPTANLHAATKQYVDNAGVDGIATNVTGSTAPTASGTDTLAFGENVAMSGNFNVGIGRNISNSANGAVLIGNSVTADSTATAGVAIGATSGTNNAYSVSIGVASDAGTSGNTDSSVAVGGYSQATGEKAVAVGHDADATYQHGVAVGGDARVQANDSTAIGTDSVVTHANSTALGYQAATSAANQVMLGNSSVTEVAVANSSYTPANDTSLATKKYVDDSGVSTKYAQYFATAADQHINVEASSPSTIDVDLFDEGTAFNPLSGDSYSAATSEGFTYTHATSNATQSADGSGVQIVNASGADIDLSTFTLAVNMTVSNLTTVGTMRIQAGTSAGGTQYGLGSGDPSGTGAFTITDVLTGTLTNGSSMYVTLRAYDGNGFGDMDFDITVDSIHLYPTAKGSMSNVATSANEYVGFSATYASGMSLIGTNATDSATASDYTWRPILGSSLAGGGSDGQVIGLNGTDVEFIDAVSTDYVKTSYNGPAATCSGTDALAVGESSQATQTNAVAIGGSAVASGLQSTAVGFGTDATGQGAAALGRNAQATANYAVATSQATASHVGAVALGYGATTASDYNVALGGDGARVKFAGSTTDWDIRVDGDVMKFAAGGTDVMKIDASGNLTVIGDVTASGTI